MAASARRFDELSRPLYTTRMFTRLSSPSEPISGGVVDRTGSGAADADAAPQKRSSSSEMSIIDGLRNGVCGAGTVLAAGALKARYVEMRLTVASCDGGERSSGTLSSSASSSIKSCVRVSDA